MAAILLIIGFTVLVQASYAPVASIIIIAGFVTILGPILWVKMHNRHALNTFTKKLELASTEEFEIEFE